MATYLITQMFTQNGNTYVNGTVNGTPVNVCFPTQVFANALLFEAFIAHLMLASVPAAIVTSAPLISSFTS